MSSFIADKIVMDGLTFDDVLLIPCNGSNGYCYREPDGYCHCS